MPMISNDLAARREELRARLQQALRNNDSDSFTATFADMMDSISQSVRAEAEQQIGDLRQSIDTSVLASRGVRQLTTAERTYYQRLADAMRSENPQQALSNPDLVMPETVINSVLEDIATNHPLLSHINFVPTGGAIKMLMNTNGYQAAAWGALNAQIVTELLAGFKEVDVTLMKLSAFLPVAKAYLDLGPEWLDRFVRETLYEGLANGMESAIITGTGKNQPIGMDRQVGAGVVVTDGVYPQKSAITVADLTAKTVGNLLSYLAVDDNGNARPVDDVLLIVNPQDYFELVFPATTLQAPDGTYRRDVLPYPMTIIQSHALSRGSAIIGMGKRYFAAVGTAKEGRIEASDHYRFLEDQRVYLIKAYANGMPMDNHAFYRLTISGLAPAVHTVEVVDARDPSSVATLSAIRIAGATWGDTPFAANTTSYTATTTDAKNAVSAWPTDANATVEVKIGTTVIDNGSLATWSAGSNTVTIKVTAEDGTTNKTYTVTVTKS